MSGRTDLFPVIAELDDEVTQLDAAGVSMVGLPGESRRYVLARTNDGVPTADGSFVVGTQGQGAFANLGDERTIEYDIGGAPTLPDADEAETWDAEAGEAVLGTIGETVRIAVLPRTHDECVRRRQERAAGPRFEARGTLGNGSNGDVSLEYDRDIDRAVAVKRLRSDDPETVLRFAEEVRTTGGLEHPNIVPIHDVGVDEAERYYFVMKYLDGETLEKVIRRLAARDPLYHRRYTVERRAEICLEVMHALAYAHARGIIHRDIKPANIMVGKFGEVMLMDWGIAKRLRAIEGAAGAPPAEDAVPAADAEPATEQDRIFTTRAGALVGTPYYMSPEQASASNDAVDERSDIYSLSVVMHELFTLRHYLSDRTTLLTVLDGIKEPDRAFASFVQDIYQAALPCEIMHFVRKGMRKDPTARFQSMTEMVDAFRTARSGRFEIQCYFTLMKRGAQGLAHLVDGHPILVTLVFLAFFIGVPLLLIAAVF